MRQVHYYSHRGRRRHPASPAARLGIGLLLPAALLVAAAAVLGSASRLMPGTDAVSGGTLLAAFGASMLRLFGAYLLALLLGVPLGLLAEGNRKVESVLLPVYDVLESLPVLAFFPVIILFFLESGLLEGAAIFILFFSMLWTIAFSTIGGLKQIPRDVWAAGKTFGLSSWQRFRHILLPGLFPPLLTASILAVADGWNIVIVAEALHAYAPASAVAQDLFGIGSILVNASAAGQQTLLLCAMGLLVVGIALVNFFLWQPLLARAERYKFE